MFSRITMRRLRMMTAGFFTASCFQLGGCQFGQITTTQTVDGRDALIQLVTAALLGPIEALIVNTINTAFDEEQ